MHLKDMTSREEQLKTRNAELEKELAEKNHELEIEAALERVRTVAMGMRKSEELIAVCEAMYKELTALGFTNIRNAQIAIKNDTKKSYSISVYSDYEVVVMKEAPYNSSPLVEEIYNELGKSGNAFYQKEFSGKKFNDWRKWREGLSPLKDSREATATSMCFYLYAIGNGHLGISTFNAITDEQVEIIKRFKNVFELSYQRYTDVAKAEAQAREAQIELALERVRARTMAMQKSDELTETSFVLFQQFKDLGETSEQISIGIFNEDEHVMELYSTVYGSQWKEAAKVDLDEPVVLKKIHAAWKEQKKSLVIDISGNDLREYNAYRKKLSNIEYREDRWVIHIAFFSRGVLTFSTKEPHPQETIQLLERFAGVFDGTYTRFLDLQKAEAQAREAQIEGALERVRSRTMGMQKSEELKEVIQVVYEQFVHLNILIEHTGFILDYKARDDMHIWLADRHEVPSEVTIPYFDCAHWNSFNEAKEKGMDFFANHLSFEEKNRFYQDLFKLIPGVPEETLEYYFSCPGLAISTVLLENVGLYIENFSGIPYSDEENKTLMRFGMVFQQTYTRFNDLQKAEAQAREAKIEAALERVRAKAMAMHKSEDLNDAVGVVFEELYKLNLGMSRCGIGILDKEKRNGDVYTTSISDQGTAVQISGDESMDIHPLLQGAFDAWLKQDDFSYVLQGEDLARYYKAVRATNIQLPELQAEVQTQYYYFSPLHAGGLFAFRDTPVPEEAKSVMKRFAGVFNLTYKRFLDIQKAEAQAREARIEASLERVRSKAMAMQKSEDLANAVGIVFEELDKLDMGTIRCGISIINKENHTANIWSTTKTEKGTALQVSGDESMDIHPLLQGAYHAWLNQEDYSYLLKGDDLKKFYTALAATNFKLPDSPGELQMQQQFMYVAHFPAGGLYVFSETEFPGDAKNVIRRFADVFNLTYTRFNDLKQAEAQAREAKIEAALERVRARALAMQEPEELKEVAQVLRHEMGLLGVEELETCSIYIHEDRSDKAECWYAIKDVREAETGKKLVSDHFALDLTDTWVGKEMLQFFHSDEKQISILMTGDHRREWIEYCYKHSPVFSGFYGEDIPDRTYHMYKFSHGAIGAASPGDISNESWGLLQRAASVFSLAYSRFRDLTQARIDLLRLKEEKLRAENALKDLKATQTQLVQSEKMASLGELTAGIAHEIQNPLNFVNNFSEVSNELLEEMKDELAKENYKDAIQIANDVKQNLEKINHHGKRADAIVKGMLQHSRSSSGQKELTDINALTDEYLRLAYHGLRAKEKSFNAIFKTDFDESIKKINIIPQDIGRVILNLITNAFYAVAEKKKQIAGDYEPTVTVSTKNLNGKVEIKVKDNGNGIPGKVLDKIFQPFFTTKPTGQGTGLGLSLSYDIVKAHGGELKVETKEGVGSTFIIVIPVAQ
jgi:signal transduction histidine kinase